MRAARLGAVVVLMGLLGSGPAWCDESINRSKAAALAQSAYGGKVISVDEITDDPAASDMEEPSPAPGTRFVVKLLQDGGRVRVLTLDAQGTILNPNGL
jgi:uncharacterized protein with GYD domain